MPALWVLHRRLPELPRSFQRILLLQRLRCFFIRSSPIVRIFLLVMMHEATGCLLKSAPKRRLRQVSGIPGPRLLGPPPSGVGTGKHEAMWRV